ncbi:MAG: tyrosine--tRNA ligase, partial [Deltaproteobacteria bacterium]|nr:tyrosine--tRNA ligase [Deltaproteobacteria bacterium]
MKNVYDILVERGFVAQVTDEETLRKRLENNQLRFYIGFDPTASSLHIGSLVPIMAMAHMQRQGHVPIVLIGGGTGLIGDPSGKTEMRQLLTREQLDDNGRGLQKQLARYLDFQDGKAIRLNNADWLTKL